MNKPWLVSADVGMHGIAWACWDSTPTLVAVGYTPSPVKIPADRYTPTAWKGLATLTVAAWAVPPDTRLIVETPQVYRSSPVNPAILLQLQSIAACLTMSHHGPSTTVLPREWKGRVPKDTHHTSLWKRLEERGWAGWVQEQVQSQRVPKARLNDLLDAIGIGLFSLGLSSSP